MRWMALRSDMDNPNDDEDNEYFNPDDVKAYYILIEKIVEHQSWEKETYNKELKKKYLAAHRVILGPKEEGSKTPNKRKEGGLRRSPTKVVKAEKSLEKAARLTGKALKKSKTKETKTNEDEYLGLTEM